MASVDNFWAMISWFGLALLFITLIVFWNAVASMSFWSESTTALKIKDDGQQAVDNFDFMLVMAWFGLHLGIIVLAYLLRTHPVVYVAGIILTAILVMVAAPISNAWEDITADSDLSTAASSIPKANYIMHKLPLFEAVWAVLTLIIMFGFARSEGLV